MRGKIVIVCTTTTMQPCSRAKKSRACGSVCPPRHHARVSNTTRVHAAQPRARTHARAHTHTDDLRIHAHNLHRPCTETWPVRDSFCYWPVEMLQTGQNVHSLKSCFGQQYMIISWSLCGVLASQQNVKLNQCYQKNFIIVMRIVFLEHDIWLYRHYS